MSLLDRLYPGTPPRPLRKETVICEPDPRTLIDILARITDVQSKVSRVETRMVRGFELLGVEVKGSGKPIDLGELK